MAERVEGWVFPSHDQQHHGVSPLPLPLVFSIPWLFFSQALGTTTTLLSPSSVLPGRTQLLLRPSSTLPLLVNSVSHLHHSLSRSLTLTYHPVTLLDPACARLYLNLCLQPILPSLFVIIYYRLNKSSTLVISS
jgi:hypothetical protein